MDAECQSGHCANGVCCDSGECCSTPDVCDDGNPCTGNACVANQCVTATLDGQVCNPASCGPTGHTASMTCLDGVCSQGGGTISCDDANPCTIDTCSIADGCWVQAVDCDDGAPCTADSCDTGTGLCSNTPISGCCTSDADCAVEDPCWSGTCDVGTGDCQAVPLTGNACSDKNPCTLADTCEAGVCLGTPHVDGFSCGTDLSPLSNCQAGECVCLPHCEVADCGDDGCGGSCGDCANGTDVCTQGWDPSSECQCDPPCAFYGDCCGDYASECEGTATTETCVGSCGAQANGGSCWCDAACSSNGDCCADYQARCVSPSLSCAGVCAGVCAKLGDVCLNPFEIDAVPFHASGTTASFTDSLDLRHPICADGYEESDYTKAETIYAFTAPQTSTYDITVTENGANNIYLRVLDSCGQQGACIAATDTEGTVVTSATVQVPLTADQTVWIAVETAAVAGDAYVLDVTGCVPNCAGKSCGDDGCGGSCGTCGSTYTCSSGTCVKQGDSCVYPYVVGALPYSGYCTTTSTTTNEFSFAAGQCSGVNGGYGASSPDKVFKFVVPATGYYRIASTASFTGVQYVTSDCTSPGAGCIEADYAAGGTEREIVRSFTAGTTVYLVFDGSTSASQYGTCNLTIEAGCNSSADCASTQYCSAGKCLTKKSNGSSCTGSSQCQSNHCNNGYCCTSGTCCSSSANCNDSNACTTDTCTASKSCSHTNLPLKTHCSTAYCSGGVYYKADLCSMDGTCQDSGTESYSCGDKKCHSACETTSSCASDCKLTPTYTVKSGEHFKGSNTAGPSNVSTYSCNSYSYPGDEMVYKYVAPAAGTMEVVLAGGDGNLDALVIEDTGSGCNPNDCVGYGEGNGTHSYTVKAGTTYCIVVDYYSNALGSSAFELSTTFKASTGVCSARLYEDWSHGWKGAWTTTGTGWGVGYDATSGTHSQLSPATDPNALLVSPAFSGGGCSNLELSFSMWWTGLTYMGAVGPKVLAKDLLGNYSPLAVAGSCLNSCGTYSIGGGCSCSASCAASGNCCSDFGAVCMVCNSAPNVWCVSGSNPTTIKIPAGTLSNYVPGNLIKFGFQCSGCTFAGGALHVDNVKLGVPGAPP